jgi:acyl-CoA reductase-like NAD-dependent aldehyde dehydrogenase
VVAASTEELVGSVPEGTTADIDAAVKAARAAFDEESGWSSWSAEDRAQALERLACALVSRSEETARRVSLQNGMPISIALHVEAVFPAVLARYYAGMIRQTRLEEDRQGLLGGTIHVLSKPVGVVGAIVPWNFPQTLAMFKLAPLLAAGCTVVIKPSPETVLDSLLLAEAIVEAGLPAGVVNIVPGGREAGAYLVEHPSVDKVAFTGSIAAGRVIARRCGELLRPVTLELGGKSAAIVLDDADLSQAAEALFGATLLNNGQTCYLGTRVLAPRLRYDEILEIFGGLAGALQVGDSLDPSTQIGPMVSARQRERVEGYIEKGRAEGARVITGGGRPEGQDRGWFVAPTILVCCLQAMADGNARRLPHPHPFLGVRQRVHPHRHGDPCHQHCDGCLDRCRCGPLGRRPRGDRWWPRRLLPRTAPRESESARRSSPSPERSTRRGRALPYRRRAQSMAPTVGACNRGDLGRVPRRPGSVARH